MIVGEQKGGASTCIEKKKLDRHNAKLSVFVIVFSAYAKTKNSKTKARDQLFRKLSQRCDCSQYCDT